MDAFDSLPPNLQGAVLLSEVLKHCFEYGVRPPGSKKEGKRWRRNEFAGEVGRDRRTIGFWLTDVHPPKEALSLERAFCGENPADRAELRKVIRAALKRSQEKAVRTRSHEKQTLGGSGRAGLVAVMGKRGDTASWREAGQLLVGAVGVGIGLIHIVWLASAIASLDPLQLWQDPWTYADVLFGGGGVIIGFGVMARQKWSRLGGICYCFLGVICPILWSVDDVSKGAAQVVVLLNELSFLLAASAGLFLLLGWRVDDKTSGSLA
jgi:hypothetical protein